MKRFRHYRKDKAILIAAFGSISKEEYYEDFKEYIEKEFSDSFVYMSFSSRTILKYLKSKKGKEYKTQAEALAYLDREGYKKQVVLSLNLFPTDEHSYCRKISDAFASFSPSHIRTTKAIFTKTDDANTVLLDIETKVRKEHPSSICLYVVHGAPYFEQAGLQSISYSRDFLNTLNPLSFVCALEGAYRFDFIKESLIERFKKLLVKDITIVPMLLVSGSHFTNDIKAMEEIFRTEGFNVGVQSSVVDSKNHFYLLELSSLRNVVKKGIEDEIKKIG